MLTTEQASTLAGVPLADGKRGTGGAQGLCTWPAGLQANATIVLVQPGDIVTAQAAYAAALQADNKLTTHGLTLTLLPTYDGGAYIGRSSANGTSTTAMGVLDGSYFVIVGSSVPGSGPSDNVIKFAATLVLGKLP